MANYNAMSEAVMERILKLSKVFKAAEVAEMLGISLSSVYKVLRADQSAAAGDVDALMGCLSNTTINWAAKRNGLDLTPPEPKKPEPVVETPHAPEKHQDNTAVCFVKLLTALDSIRCSLSEINAALSRLNGRVCNIENAHANAIDKESLNANFNLLFSELKEARG